MKPACLLIPLLALAACTPAPAPQAETVGTGQASAAGAAPVAPSTSSTPTQGVDAPAPAPAPTAEASAVRTDGYAGLRFGMTEPEARKAWRGELKGDEVKSDNCAYLRPKADDEIRVGFMFEGGKFVRYDVDIPSETAPGGGRVGQSRADIERLYAGRVAVQPHEYVTGGNYLRVTEPGIQNGALVFETDEKGTVTRWRIGRAPAVDYVEGCS